MGSDSAAVRSAGSRGAAKHVGCSSDAQLRPYRLTRPKTTSLPLNRMIHMEGRLAAWSVLQKVQVAEACKLHASVLLHHVCYVHCSSVTK